MKFTHSSLLPSTNVLTHATLWPISRSVSIRHMLPRCGAVSHIVCLANHFTRGEEGQRLLPVRGACPVCDQVSLWGDIIRYGLRNIRLLLLYGDFTHTYNFRKKKGVDSEKPKKSRRKKTDTVPQQDPPATTPPPPPPPPRPATPPRLQAESQSDEDLFGDSF